MLHVNGVHMIEDNRYIAQSPSMSQSLTVSLCYVSFFSQRINICQDRANDIADRRALIGPILAADDVDEANTWVDGHCCSWLRVCSHAGIHEGLY